MKLNPFVLGRYWMIFNIAASFLYVVISGCNNYECLNWLGWAVIVSFVAQIAIIGGIAIYFGLKNLYLGIKKWFK